MKRHLERISRNEPRHTHGPFDWFLDWSKIGHTEDWGYYTKPSDPITTHDLSEFDTISVFDTFRNTYRKEMLHSGNTIILLRQHIIECADFLLETLIAFGFPRIFYTGRPNSTDPRMATKILTHPEVTLIRCSHELYGYRKESGLKASQLMLEEATKSISDLQTKRFVLMDEGQLALEGFRAWRDNTPLRDRPGEVIFGVQTRGGEVALRKLNPEYPAITISSCAAKQLIESYTIALSIYNNYKKADFRHLTTIREKLCCAFEHPDLPESREVFSKLADVLPSAEYDLLSRILENEYKIIPKDFIRKLQETGTWDCLEDIPSKEMPQFHLRISPSISQIIAPLGESSDPVTPTELWKKIEEIMTTAYAERPGCEGGSLENDLKVVKKAFNFIIEEIPDRNAPENTQSFYCPIYSIWDKLRNAFDNPKEAEHQGLLGNLQKAFSHLPKRKAIAVIGSAGHIGRRLVQLLLKKEFTVYCYDKKQSVDPETMRNYNHSNCHQMESIKAAIFPARYVLSCAGADISAEVDLTTIPFQHSIVTFSGVNSGDYVTLVRRHRIRKNPFSRIPSSVANSLFERAPIQLMREDRKIIQITNGSSSMNFFQKVNVCPPEEIALTRLLTLGIFVHADRLTELRPGIVPLDPEIQQTCVFIWYKMLQKEYQENQRVPRFIEEFFDGNWKLFHENYVQRFNDLGWIAEHSRRQNEPEDVTEGEEEYECEEECEGETVPVKSRFNQATMFHPREEVQPVSAPVLNTEHEADGEDTECRKPSK